MLVAIALAHLAGGSLADAHWTRESIDLASIAALAAAVMGLVAALRVPGTIPLVAFALVVGLAIGHFGSADLVARPGDPAGPALAVTWARRLTADATLGLGGLNAALSSLLAAGTGGVTAWEAVRLRRPLLAAAPVATVFAVGILNAEGDHLSATVAFLALVLLLWLVAAGGRLRDAPDGDGLRITAAAHARILGAGCLLAVLAVGVAAIAPPLSSRDSSGIFDSGLSRWRTALGGTSPGTAVGFSLEVPLGGSLAANSQPVLTYTYEGTAPAAAPLYLRGVNLAQTSAGQWRQVAGETNRVVFSGQAITYADPVEAQVPMRVHVTVVSPPGAAPALVFYPGRLERVDGGVIVTAPVSVRGPRIGVFTADEVQLLTSAASSYTVDTQVSTATAEQLEAAGTAYPTWVLPYANLSASFGGPYRPAPVLTRVRNLAEKVTLDARSPYDRAKAIETYLRGNYGYTLAPPPTPVGTDPIDYFLFTSRRGYCQFYATAMGDMLRSLGIPTRLVNGFGPGSSSGPGGEYTVTSSDAHTWVEVYFPTYGWIPFEPTPQVGYGPIARGPAIAAGVADPALPDPAPSSAPVATPAAAAGDGSTGSVRTGTVPNSIPWALVPAALLLLLALVAGAAAWRPRDSRGAWRRIGLLGSFAGVPRLRSDTPHEYGRRLAAGYPDLEALVTPLTDAYARSVYSTGGGPATAEKVLRGWSRLAPALLRRSLRRALRLA